jgi:Flp pilus assembly protein TadG
MAKRLPRLIDRFLARKDGNVTMMFALGAPLMCLGVAVAVDYSNATVVKTKLNAAADAAALAALTPAMLQQSDDTAKAAAVAMFNARAAALGSLVNGQTSVSATIVHPNNNGNVRKVTIAYSAQNNTIFNGVLNQDSMTISGTSTAQASVPPNIDFYLLLDNSPSMALPASSAGIAQMIKLTPTQDGGNGCAFACHQASTNNSDTMGNTCSDGSTPTLSAGTIKNQYCASKNSKGQAITQIDNFQLARNNNIPLRLDELSNGVTALMATAGKYQSSGMWSAPPTYRFAAYSMDSLWSIGSSNTQIMALSSNYSSDWTSSQSKFGVMQMYANNVTCGNSACSSGGSDGDVATNYDNAMSDINAKMPAPGSGTNISGDKPLEVLFFVTDGVEDEQNINRLIQPINANNSTNYCTAIKNRGIKIAVLYTEYLPVTTNAFYNSTVKNFQSNIGPALQACATPGLFYDATFDTDLGAALSQLFQAVVQSAALSN